MDRPLRARTTVPRTGAEPGGRARVVVGRLADARLARRHVRRRRRCATRSPDGCRRGHARPVLAGARAASVRPQCVRPAGGDRARRGDGLARRPAGAALRTHAARPRARHDGGPGVLQRRRDRRAPRRAASPARRVRVRATSWARSRALAGDGLRPRAAAGVARSSVERAHACRRTRALRDRTAGTTLAGCCVPPRSAAQPAQMSPSGIPPAMMRSSCTGVNGGSNRSRCS